MQDLKISLITVVYNAQNTLGNSIESVLKQSFKNIQYIIIDGGSTDNTLQIIDKYKDRIDFFISEPDRGVYDAMNKGIAQATGDIIGTLNADDFYPNEGVLQEVAAAFANQQVDALYGDLDYVDSRGESVRKWRSGIYRDGMFNRGWMPPHPTFFCKSKLFERFGSYSLEYGSAADYELMLRFIHLNKIPVFYLNKVTVKMAVGGISNRNFNNRIKAMRNDLKAMRSNNILLPFFTIVLKPLRKIRQFF